MQVTNLLGKKKVYVYYINKLSQLRVYLDRTQVSTCILYINIYPSHGYTVLAADEIFIKYQAILACRGSLGTYRYMQILYCPWGV